MTKLKSCYERVRATFAPQRKSFDNETSGLLRPYSTLYARIRRDQLHGRNESVGGLKSYIGKNYVVNVWWLTKVRGRQLKCESLEIKTIQSIDKVRSAFVVYW